MIGSIYMATTGALAAEKRLQIISNNLPNISNAGFKKDGGRFQSFDLSEKTGNIQYSACEAQTDAPYFWMQFSSFTDFLSGRLRKTGNPYDLALNIRGFFCVQTPDGIQFTRKGDFTINADEMLVTQEAGRYWV